MSDLKNKRVISAAIIGSWPTRQDNPNVPLTPAEIAESAYQAWKAGAAIVHIHARDKEGLSTNDLTTALKTSYDGAVSGVADLKKVGAEKNTIVGIKVNGTAQTVDSSRNVDLTVPTDSQIATQIEGYGYQTASQVDKAVTDKAAFTNAYHATGTFGGVTVSKTLQGRASTPGQFTFDVTGLWYNGV